MFGYLHSALDLFLGSVLFGWCGLSRLSTIHLGCLKWMFKFCLCRPCSSQSHSLHWPAVWQCRTSCLSVQVKMQFHSPMSSHSVYSFCPLEIWPYYMNWPEQKGVKALKAFFHFQHQFLSVPHCRWDSRTSQGWHRRATVFQEWLNSLASHSSKVVYGPNNRSSSLLPSTLAVYQQL